MAIIIKPKTLTNGTTADATDVESDFNTIYNDYNGNITNDNISVSAAIVDTKLAQIVTGSKVSGLALTSLASITSAAGYIPQDNIGSIPGASLTSLASITSAAGIIPLANMASGTSATQLIALDVSAKLPAVDGSQLTNIGNLVKVSSVSITTATTTTFSSLTNSKRYKLIVNTTQNTATGYPYILINGNTGTNYKYSISFGRNNSNGDTSSNTAPAIFLIDTASGVVQTSPFIAELTFANISTTSIAITGSSGYLDGGGSSNTSTANIFGYYSNDAMTSFVVGSSGGTMTGTLTLYEMT